MAWGKGSHSSYQQVLADQKTAATSKRTNRTVWVIMKQQPNYATMPKSNVWATRGTDVYSALTATANTSQASLIGYLKTNKIPFKSFWLKNAVKITTDQDTIDTIAARADVGSVINDGSYYIPIPERSAATARTQSIEWNIDNIKAPMVWDNLGTKGEGIVVATIDTGVQYTHPALVNQYRGHNADGTFDHNYNWYDPSFVCGSPSLEPCDNASHGTHTMGTILGDDGGDNQIGVAPGARWMAAKGCETMSCSYEALMSSGQWLMAPTDLNGQNPRPDLRPHIVSNSWGGGSGDTFYQAIVQGWIAAGMFPVFAAGNNGSYCGSVSSPGDYTETYSVGAYDSTTTIAYFSGRGPSFFGENKPDISAPGVYVRSSVPDGYDYFSGTSMATPHVAGTVALMWSAAASLNGDIVTTRALLDESAIDKEDTSCGGTASKNNVYGEGMLDAYRAVELSPRGPTGNVDGSVKNTLDAPIASAKVSISGPLERTSYTGSEGTYHFRAPVGSYSITASAFAYYSQTFGVDVTENGTTVQNFALAAAPSHAVNGVIKDDEGLPVASATVTIADTPIAPAVSDSNGKFNFTAVPEGTYQLLVAAGNCLDPVSMTLTVDSDETVPVSMVSRTDSYGYACRIVPMDYVATDNPISLYGENVTTSVSLPFKYMLYGKLSDKAIVSSSGYLSFDGASQYYDNLPIPDPTLPNTALYGFWDDNFMDESSSLGTKVLGTAPNRQFVMEWRNVAVAYDFNKRITFEMVLSESNGDVKFQYLNVDPSPGGMGAAATVGIENANGTAAFEYSYNKPVLSNGVAIHYFIPHSGLLQGYVTDANDGLPVSGVQVAALDSLGATRSTTTDDSGFYAFQARAGVYSLTATKKNYGDGTATSTIVENGTSTQGFSLKTARAVVSPTLVQLVMPKNTTRTRALSLSNTGSLALAYDLRESGGQKQVTVSSAGLKVAANADKQARTTKGIYAQSGELKGWQAQETGDTLFSFVPTGMSLAWGVGFTGNLWLGDFSALQNKEFTSAGNPTGLSFSAPWGGYAIADMAYDSARNRVCQLAVTNDYAIHCWDPTNGNVSYTLTGAWAQTSQRGLAYRADDDSFYVGGWYDGTIYHIQGQSGPQPGQVISSCRPSDPSISGLAYNDAMGVLWVATNSLTDTIYELNPNDCSVLGTLKHPQSGGYQGAGLDMDSEGNLWLIGQSPNTVYLVDSGVPAYADVPWLSITPTSGTLATGGKQSLSVTVNTQGLDAGLYTASIFLTTNSGRNPRVRIPVSLVVSAYQQAVNVGGAAFTDSLGDPWTADQAWAAGGWGYVQKGSVITSKKTIAGTTEQSLYQNLREDPYAYRFDNVPNGTYQVDLDFAELAGAKVGKRLFDVIIEDTTALPAHDIVYEVGDLTAEARTFFVPVTDNRVDVRFIARRGYKLPVVNALRVTLRPDK